MAISWDWDLLFSFIRQTLRLAVVLAAGAFVALGQDGGGASAPWPDWLDIGIEARSRTEFRTNFDNDPDSDDTVNWTRLRLNVGLEATPWLRFTFQGQDSRLQGLAAGRARTNVDYFDIRQAYVSLGRAEGSQVHVGRQALQYGDDRLIGRRNWHDVDPGWDAARVVLRRGENQVDIFSMAFVEFEAERFDRPIQGNRLHGFYGRIGSLIPSAHLEPYVVYASQPRFNGVQDRGADSGAYTAGFRLAGEALPWLDYDVELTGQRGHARDIELRGWASAASVTLGTDDLPLKSRFEILHDFASGDDSREAGRQTAFDPLHHARHKHLGAVDVVGRRNISALTVGWEGYLHPKWRLRLNRLDFWLASRYDGLYGINGRLSVAAPAQGASSRHVGTEWDALLRYATPIQGLTVEGGLGLFDAKKFLQDEVGEYADRKLVQLTVELQL